jgi:hypothetical protein
MDEAVLSAYKQFLPGVGGVDLINRLKLTEAKYMMEGMKSPTMEGKAISLSKMQACYEIRTMLDDLVKPKTA